MHTHPILLLALHAAAHHGHPIGVKDVFFILCVIGLVVAGIGKGISSLTHSS